jgi:HK97 family phage prohead protease
MIRRKALGAQVSTLAEKRQVRVTCSTPDVGRDGLVLETAGIDLAAFRTNPVVLWQHDADKPVARAIQIGVEGDALKALVQFPPDGVSATADEVYGLIKAGVVNAVSAGFEPIETKPRGIEGGERIIRSELLEFSFVSIPALPSALITERAAPRRQHPRRAIVDPVARARLLRSLTENGWRKLLALASLVERIGDVRQQALVEASVDASPRDTIRLIGMAARDVGAALASIGPAEAQALIGPDRARIAREARAAFAETRSAISRASRPRVPERSREERQRFAVKVREFLAQEAAREDPPDGTVRPVFRGDPYAYAAEMRAHLIKKATR